jgi:hypothetical protein
MFECPLNSSLISEPRRACSHKFFVRRFDQSLLVNALDARRSFKALAENTERSECYKSCWPSQASGRRCSAVDDPSGSLRHPLFYARDCKKILTSHESPPPKIHGGVETKKTVRR